MNKLLSIFILAGFASCGIEPQEISYGQDACHFCKMTIVDRQHSAQLVTEKGKAFKYDAIECMMNHLDKWEEPPVSLYLVANYTNPGELTDATSAHYLISEAIPSPMGQNLTAFKEVRDREQITGNAGGTELSWFELKGRFVSE